MLIKFKVNRFRGFSQELCWDLSHPSNYEFNTHALKNGIIKNGIVFGPNGCGKSNFSKAVFDIINHLSQKFKMDDYYECCIYAGNPNDLMDFDYTFQFGDRRVEYVYSKNGKGLLIKESLFVDNQKVFVKLPGSLDIDTEEFPMNQATKDSISINANNISVVNYLLSTYPLSEDHYLIKLKNFVDGMLWFANLDQRRFMGLEPIVSNIHEFLIKKKLVGDFEKFLLEESGQRFNFVAPKPDDKELFCAFGSNVVKFDSIASTGTRSLLLLYYWIKNLDRASFVFIDEFDAFYHFDLSYKVCEALFKLDCQVFTTSHNTSLMDNELLRPDCFFILNNNKIQPFYQCTDKELRFAHNLEKMYRGKGLEVR